MLMRAFFRHRFRHAAGALVGTGLLGLVGVAALPDPAPRTIAVVPPERFTNLAAVVSGEPPQVLEFYPAEGASGTPAGFEDPITVRFDRSATDWYMDFRFTPSVGPVLYQHNADKTVFRVVPQTPLPGETEFSVELYAKRRVGLGDPEPQLVHRSRFTTAPAPQFSRTQLEARVAAARSNTLAKRGEGKYIDINLKFQVMTLFEDGRPVASYPVSSGRHGMETPTGTFTIHNKAPRPWSREYHLFMPHWMAITPDGKYGIHELPEWPGGYKEGAQHLGLPVSHGCVRLGVGAAKEVYTWTEVGTPVVVY